MNYKVIFLDRDGVINEDLGYVHKSKDFIFIEGVFSSLKRLQSLGYKFIVVTNQSGIGRNFFSVQDYRDLDNWMILRFKENGIDILDTFFCPHTPLDKCKCRKPKPGLFNQAIEKYNIDIDSSWMIGDSERDIVAANRIGIRNSILVRSGHEINEKNSSAKFVIDSINNVNEIINF